MSNFKLQLCGDIHGEWDKMLANFDQDSPLIQLGDFGLMSEEDKVPKLPQYWGFIRGNHDNPALCQKHPNYLGDYGVSGSIIPGKTVFFLSGAWSIDSSFRTFGRDVFVDEELSYSQLNNAIDMYLAAKPDIVLTHECPIEVLEAIYTNAPGSLNFKQVIPTRTAQALDVMHQHHQPEQWFFGHHHVQWEKEINSTKFRCVDILEEVIITE